jgi:hypothetical protein
MKIITKESIARLSGVFIYGVLFFLGLRYISGYSWLRSLISTLAGMLFFYVITSLLVQHLAKNRKTKEHSYGKKMP